MRDGKRNTIVVNLSDVVYTVNKPAEKLMVTRESLEYFLLTFAYSEF